MTSRMSIHPEDHAPGIGSVTSGQSPTPGQLLCQAFSDTFNGGGWVDAPVWDDFDEDGQARYALAAARYEELRPEFAAAPDQNAALLALVDRFNRFLASDRNQADAYNILVKGAFADWERAVAAIAKTTGGG